MPSKEGAMQRAAAEAPSLPLIILGPFLTTILIGLEYYNSGRLQGKDLQGTALLRRELPGKCEDTRKAESSIKCSSGICNRWHLFQRNL